MKHAKTKDRSDYFSYIAGRVEAQIEAYAGSAGVPVADLTGWVGGFLLRKASGSLLGPVNSVSSLSETTANGNEMGSSKMALARRSHGDVSAKAEGKTAVAVKHGRGRPKKGVHWTQTAKGRAFMRKRMKQYWRQGTFKNRKKQGA